MKQFFEQLFGGSEKMNALPSLPYTVSGKKLQIKLADVTHQAMRISHLAVQTLAIVVETKFRGYRFVSAYDLNQFFEEEYIRVKDGVNHPYDAKSPVWKFYPWLGTRNLFDEINPNNIHFTANDADIVINHNICPRTREDLTTLFVNRT
jgi:hypothetical protein